MLKSRENFSIEIVMPECFVGGISVEKSVINQCGHRQFHLLQKSISFVAE